MWVAAVHALLTWLTPEFASPFGPAAPFFPAAGFALACAWVFGWRVLPALAVGAWAATGFSLGMASAAATCTVVAQATVGVWLMRRADAHRRCLLDTPRDILRMLVLPALAMAIVGAFAAVMTGPPPAAAHAIEFAAVSRFGAEIAGVLLAAPMTLAFIGRPRRRWAARRLTLALPLAAAVILLMLALKVVERWDHERAQEAFANDAQTVTLKMRDRLGLALNTVEAMHGAMLAAKGRLPAPEFERMAKPWLQRMPGLDTTGWHERVPLAGIPAFEARVRAEGEAGYRVFNHPDGLPRQVLAADDAVIAVRHAVMPLTEAAGRQAVLGLNALSIPDARPAILRALAEDRVLASPVFRLTQQTAPGAGFVIYRRVRLQGEGVAGLVYATVFLDPLLATTLAEAPRRYVHCLFDTEPGIAVSRLSGPPGCETRAGASANLRWQTPVEFAGRNWSLAIEQPLAEALRSGGFWNVWLFAVPGLLGAALLGTLLLVNTGRVERVQNEVERRAAQLRREMQEREQAEQALADSESELRSMFDTVTIGVIRVDHDGIIRNANAAFCELTGYGIDELRGMNIREITPEEDRVVDERVATLFLDHQDDAYRSHRHYRTKSGRIVPVALTSRVVRGADGTALHTVTAVQDRRESLRLREAERVRDEAEGASRAKSRFLARMSHELRTPLNAILGFAQLLARQGDVQDGSRAREWLGHIGRAGWHLLAMVDDALDLSRIEADALAVTLQRIDLAEAVHAALGMVEGVAVARGIDRSVVIEPGAEAVTGDPLRARQIFINLLSNAVKYNQDGGRIEVRSHRIANGQIEIEVSDSGLGMSEEQLAALFQPFNRLGRERTDAEGTGIGLVIAKRLAELMGGALRARSVLGQGTVFTLTLPPAAMPAAVPAQAADGTAGEAADGIARHVVYIEDNEVNAEIMRGMLAHRPGIRLTVAGTAMAGMAVVLAERPDLILLDIGLPDIDGLELLRRLKADTRLQPIPVVMVSAHVMSDDVEAALAAGAADYLTKPLELAVMLRLVDRELAGPG